MENGSYGGVIGHYWATNLLRSSIRNGRIPQALLIVGPPSIGKTSLALAYAKALNCKENSPPCDACPSCHKVDNGNHPDVIMLDEEEVSIKIDNVRQLQHDLSLTPYEDGYKIAILAHFQRATLEAANALLKTLEEPPPRAVIILTALETELILPTIVSRTQIFALRHLPIDLVQKHLMAAYGMTEERARLLAGLSSGRIGWAIRAFTDANLLPERDLLLNRLRELLAGSRRIRLEYGREQSESASKVKEFLNHCLSYWRDLLLARAGSEAFIANIDRREEIREIASRLELNTIHEILLFLHKALNYLDANANARMVLEASLLKMPGKLTFSQE